MVKKCELCKVRARTFCESDQASLCWTCDAKVHGANFLVARHSRTLLCRACDSPTPWKATGAALVNAVSVCDHCANREQQQEEDEEESEGGNDDEIDTDNDDDNDGDEDGDNQVVPWSSSLTSPPPASSSCSEESVNGVGDGSDPATMTTTSLKRRRYDGASDPDFQEGSSGSASQRRCGGEWREEVAERDGEPPLKKWLGPLKLNGSRSCFRNGGASDGV